MSTSRIIPQSVGIFKCLILCHGVRARSRACVCASAPREWICMYPRVQDLKDSPSGDSCRLTPALHLPSLTFPTSKPFFQPSLSFVSYFPLFFFLLNFYIYIFFFLVCGFLRRVFRYFVIIRHADGNARRVASHHRTTAQKQVMSGRRKSRKKNK